MFRSYPQAAVIPALVIKSRCPSNDSCVARQQYMVRRGNLTDFTSPLSAFYWAGAVAKLGLFTAPAPFQLADPVATMRLARKASMA
jgi:hypothetical protein